LPQRALAHAASNSFISLSLSPLTLPDPSSDGGEEWGEVERWVGLKSEEEKGKKEKKRKIKK